MKIGVIADDITGSNATGVILAKHGLKALSLNRFSNTEIEMDLGICINTDSRNEEKLVAKSLVKKVMNEFLNWQADIIVKRIDSTLRGNIGIEIDAMLEVASNDTIAIIVPSYPSSGRVVVGGNMLVNSILLQESELSVDPLAPVSSSYVPEIIQNQSQNSVGLININHILLGPSELTKEIKKKVFMGNKLIVFDAISEHHIENIAIAIEGIKDMPIILVDPGPLTNHFIRYKKNKGKELSKVLAAVGSATETTNKQLDYLIKKTGVNPVYVNPEKLATFSSNWQIEINRCVKEALEAMEGHNLIVITTNNPKFPLLNLKEIAIRESYTENLIAKRITEGLSEITKQLLTLNTNIKGCFFSGGDVASSFCEKVDTKGLQLIDELMPLSSFGRIIDGEFEGLPIVTKGGMVGDETAIYKGLMYLEEKVLYDRGVLFGG